MKSLLPVSTVLLGAATTGATRPTAGLAPGGGSWRATWTNPAGELMQATAPLAGGGWSDLAPVPAGDRPADPASEPARPEGFLACADHGGGRVGLRAGRRVPGVRPQFPGAGLVISRTVDGGWHDVAFADDPPDAEISTASLCVAGENVLVVYLTQDGQGRAVCRALRFPLAAGRATADDWRRLPDFPLAPGVAGVLAGMHGDVLIAAGGANFPDRPPWEGGVKKTYDEIFVLLPGEQTWRPAGRLPEPRAYAAVVGVPGGVLVIGGENATHLFSDVMLLRWGGYGVSIQPAPSLPVPLANPVGVILDGVVYVAGGYEAGPPRRSTGGFFFLDLADSTAGWQRLPTWPGPARAQGVMAALDGAVYLISGLELGAGPDGKPQTNFLTDAYRYRPGGAWERLPDLPWSALAAPTPAPVTATPPRVFVLGGVDGRQAGKLPRDTRVPADILCFDVTRHEWCLWPEPWPEPVVTAPAVPAAGQWIFVSGETMAGKRTTVVQAWQPGI